MDHLLGIIAKTERAREAKSIKCVSSSSSGYLTEELDYLEHAQAKRDGKISASPAASVGPVPWAGIGIDIEAAAIPE